MAHMVKNLPAMRETWLGSIPGLERSTGEDMAIRSSTLAWRIPWRGDLVGYSPWDNKESDMTEQLSACTHTHTHTHTHICISMLSMCKKM